MVQGVNNVLTAFVQSSSQSKNKTVETNTSTTKLDTYIKTTAPISDYSIYGGSYPKDEFEQNLSPDDLKFFVFWANGTYRVPNVGASPALKQQWLDYSKKMSDDGFTPDDLLKMQIGTTPTSIIWFPNANASVDTKKAWIEARQKMDPIAADQMVDSIKNNFAGSYNPQDFNTPDYWERISKGVSGISSYQDLFSICEKNTKIEGDKNAESKFENCFKVLRDTFTQYNVK